MFMIINIKKRANLIKFAPTNLKKDCFQPITQMNYTTLTIPRQLQTIHQHNINQKFTCCNVNNNHIYMMN